MLPMIAQRLNDYSANQFINELFETSKLLGILEDKISGYQFSSILIPVFRNKEAVSSMMIEGTQTTITDVFEDCISTVKGNDDKAMRHVEASGDDMTYFIDYYSAMLARSVDSMEKHLFRHVLADRIMQSPELSGQLNDRQQKGARWLLEGDSDSITVEAWKKKFRTATETARQDLLTLCDAGILTRTMDGRRALFVIQRNI